MTETQKTILIEKLFAAMNTAFQFVSMTSGVSSAGTISTADGATQIINLRTDNSGSASAWKTFLDGPKNGDVIGTGSDLVIGIDEWPHSSKDGQYGSNWVFNAGRLPKEFSIKVSSLDAAVLCFSFPDEPDCWEYLNWMACELEYIGANGKPKTH